MRHPATWRALTNAIPTLLLIGTVALATGACELASPASPDGGVGHPAGTDVGTSVFEAERAFCVDELNRYRASVGRPPLQRSAQLEEFSNTVAQNDATVRQAHAFFRSNNGAGVARAETEILWWRGYAVQQVIKKGLSQMWQVGPGGEHYDVIAGPYTEVGCGIFVNGGEVTVAQDFR